nr:GDSL-type esterase/lipase family protein [uncultured Oscillibacter sp.]
MYSAIAADMPNLRPLACGFSKRAGTLPLYWAGSGVELLFTGQALCLRFEADFTVHAPWIAAELNGAQILRMPLNRGRNEVCLFQGMTDGVPKHIRVFKETQPITDDTRRRLDVTRLSWEGGSFLPLPALDVHLEFIGDSLTSGEGIVGARSETDWVSALFSASRTWARLTADQLNASFCTVSQSGWGVCSGWDGDLSHVLPSWYEETASLRNQEPSAILVNLGTNDASAIQSGMVSMEDFDEAACHFLQTLRNKHPRAKLVWAYGMLGDVLRPHLEQIISRFDGAWYLPLPPMTEETEGSRQHPGPLCHQAAAQVTANFLKTIL